jgi:hypothetical protein
MRIEESDGKEGEKEEEGLEKLIQRSQKVGALNGQSKNQRCSHDGVEELPVLHGCSGSSGSRGLFEARAIGSLTIKGVGSSFDDALDPSRRKLSS